MASALVGHGPLLPASGFRPRSAAQATPAKTMRGPVGKAHSAQCARPLTAGSQERLPVRATAAASMQPTFQAPSGPLFTIKAMLLDSLLGTERGLSARGEVRAEINELISQLEGYAVGVNTSDLLDGTWELIYTNASDLLAVLAAGNIPLSPLRVGSVTQEINSAAKTVENKVQIQMPLLSTSLSTVATYEVASPKRLQFQVVRGVVQTPSLLTSLELPATLTVLGQVVDVTMVRDALQPLTRGAQGLAASVTDLLSQTPNPSIQLPVQGSWQLNTYVDEEGLRITRGDGGAVFVFRKQM